MWFGCWEEARYERKVCYVYAVQRPGGRVGGGPGLTGGGPGGFSHDLAGGGEGERDAGENASRALALCGCI